MNPLLLQNREWLIQPDALHAMVTTLRSNADRGEAPTIQRPPNSLLSVEDGIATVSIEGPILRKPDFFARAFFGATSSEEIGAALREAGSRDDIKAVFLDIDSPGGTVAGTPELATAVSSLNAQKPVYAFTSGLMASAAYWVASQARAIYATPSAQIGSIGVVQAVVDNSGALDKAGVKVEVFSVGKYKAMGAPGTPLTDEQRELISSNLAEIAGEFHTAVLAKGRAIPAEAMEGQTFSGKQAQRFNLAGMVQDRSEAMRRLKVYHAWVDTGARSMSQAPEDLLAEARTQVETLHRDFQAQTELLTEESAAVTSLRGEIVSLTTEIDSLTTERDSTSGQLIELQSRIAELQAAQTEFDTRVQTEVARVVASTGTNVPAFITPAGDPQQAPNISVTDLIARYDELVSANKSEEAAIFYQQHLAKLLTR